MTANSELRTEITADSKKFTRGVNEAVNEAKRFGKETTSVFKEVAAAFVGTIALGGLIEGLKSASDSIDKLAASAKKLDISSQGFQFLEYAAKRSDVEIGSLEGGLSKLRKTLASAVGGNKTAADSFKQLGLDANQLSKVGLDKAYEIIANKISLIGDSTLQAGVAIDIFGRGGQEQLNLLRSGTEELKKEFNDLDIALSPEDIESYDKLDKATDRVASKLKHTMQEALLALAPYITSFADSLVEALKYLDKVPDKISSIKKLIGTGNYDPKNSVSSLSDFRDYLSIGINDYISTRNQVQQQLTDQAIPSSNRSSIPNYQDGARRSGLDINVETEFNKLAKSAAAASDALQKIHDVKLKELFGIQSDDSATAKNYLQSILTEKPQAKSDEFTRAANEIRDIVAGGSSDVGYGGSLKQRVADLESLAKHSAGYQYDSSGNATEVSNSGMLAVVKALKEGMGFDKKTPEVKVSIEVDKDGMFTALATSERGMALIEDAAKSAAAKEARAVK